MVSKIKYTMFRTDIELLHSSISAAAQPWKPRNCMVRKVCGTIGRLRVLSQCVRKANGVFSWKLRIYSVTLILIKISMTYTYVTLSTRCLLLYML